VRVSESGFILVVWGKKGGGGGCGGEWREVKNGGWVGRRVEVEGWGWGVFGESDDLGKVVKVRARSGSPPQRIVDRLLV